MPDWPQSPDEWRSQIAECIGLDEDAAAHRYSTGTFPYEALVRCLRDAFGADAGYHEGFADALARNRRGLVDWAFGDGSEPWWPGRDPQEGV